MTNLVITFKNTISQSARYTKTSYRKAVSGRVTEPAQNISYSEPNCSKKIQKQWDRFKNFITKTINDIRTSPKITKEDLKVVKRSDDNVSEILKNTIGNKPYRIATAGYSFNTEGYEEITKTFLESIDRSLGSKNTGYVFPPTLDKGSIYDITAQVSGLKNDRSLFFTAEEFCGKFLDPAKFSQDVNMKEYAKKQIHVFLTPENYINATANASNVLVCTGGRKIAVKEIIEAIKRKNKVVLLHNLNLTNGIYNGTANHIENAARYFEELRLSKTIKCSAAERRELAALLKDESKINELVRVYLVNDSKSAIEAAERAAKFIKNKETKTFSETVMPSIAEIKTMSVSQLQELARIKGGLTLMQQAGVITAKPEVSVLRNIYGTIRYSQIKTPGGHVISSSLIMTDTHGKAVHIFKNIPQKILQSPASEHIHKIKWSTINPEVGIKINQNQSKSFTVRKINTEGTLEQSLLANNSNNIPLKYDIVKGTQYIDTPTGRQALTGDGFMAIYTSTAKKSDHNFLGQIIEDHSFVPADIASKQYEIITETGKRIPCCYENMVVGKDYTISKKVGVELKMAVPPTEVISSEGEILSPNKLYMVDSNGHFYDGNPILRIKNGDVTWNPDNNDIVQVRIKNLINKSLKYENDAVIAKNSGNIGLYNKLLQEAEQTTQNAEQEMTNWVKNSQNKNNAAFFI